VKSSLLPTGRIVKNQTTVKQGQEQLKQSRDRFTTGEGPECRTKLIILFVNKYDRINNMRLELNNRTFLPAGRQGSTIFEI